MNAPLHRRPVFRTRSKRGFTLTEILVVIGIIAVLAALLTPVAYRALSGSRDFAMGAEINKLQQAIENYKLDKGAYPPSNMSDTAAITRHVRKCYPKIDANNLADLISVASRMDQSEAIVFWLSRTVKNPIRPFRISEIATDSTNDDDNAEYQVYFDFDQRRLSSDDNDGTFGPMNTPLVFYSYKPQYAKNTYFVYIESGSYDFHMNTATPAVSESVNVVRPYFSDTFDSTNQFGFKFMNPTTYQILCAGQDGDWGPLLTPVRDTSPPPMMGLHQRMAATGIKRFPSGRDARGNSASDDPAFTSPATGGKFIMVEEDQDNLANFSEGRTLKNNLP